MISRGIYASALQHVRNIRQAKNAPDGTLYNMRRVSVHATDGVYVSAEFTPLARSIIGTCIIWESPAFLALRLIWVLDVLGTSFVEFPTEIFQLVNLHYLAFHCRSSVPIGISVLRNLQSLIAESCSFDVPSEIWELSQLRHLKIYGATWFQDECMKNILLKNLQKLLFLVIIRSEISKGFFESIPNIEDMGCYFESLPPDGEVVDLSHLHKLEKFRCSSKFRENGCRILPTLMFPCNLRQLTLTRCVLIPVVLTTLCALPKLEVLKIRICDFECREDETYEEWDMTAEGDEFRYLQFLHLEGLDLVHWKADENNFPRLRRLVIKECSGLEEIPCGIGEILTLQLIDLYNCSPSAVASAKEIQDMQQSDGNYDLQLLINDDREDDE